MVRSLHLFFKTAPRFRAQLDRWGRLRASSVIPLLTQAECDCKTTGFPDETICKQALVSIARLARARTAGR